MHILPTWLGFCDVDTATETEQNFESADKLFPDQVVSRPRGVYKIYTPRGINLIYPDMRG